MINKIQDGELRGCSQEWFNNRVEKLLNELIGAVNTMQTCLRPDIEERLDKLEQQTTGWVDTLHNIVKYDLPRIEQLEQQHKEHVHEFWRDTNCNTKRQTSTPTVTLPDGDKSYTIKNNGKEDVTVGGVRLKHEESKTFPEKSIPEELVHSCENCGNYHGNYHGRYTSCVIHPACIYCLSKTGEDYWTPKEPVCDTPPVGNKYKLSDLMEAKEYKELLAVVKEVYEIVMTEGSPNLLCATIASKLEVYVQ